MERGRLRRTATALLIGFSTTWLSVALIGCGGSGSDPGGSQSPSQAPSAIGAAGGQVSSADRHATLIVPPNAITTDTIFIIEPAIGAPSSDRIVGTVFDVEPTGTVFSVPAQLTLTYDALPEGVDANTLQLGTLDQGVWTVVTGSSPDAANKTVTASITHLSMYAVLQPGPTNHAPIASAGQQYVGTVDQALTLSAAGSTDQDGDTLTYTWTFGDSSSPSTTSSQTVTHAYASAGTYFATLTVTDTHGASTQATANVTITAPPPGNQPPIANAGGPYSGTAGQTVAFDGTGSTDPDGDSLTYGWDFGDLTSGTGATPAHAYSAAGTFHVTLTVSDGRGGTATAPVDAVIAPAPPVNHAPIASAGGPYTGTVNQALTLSAAGSTDQDGDPLTYTWSFGDSSSPSTTTSQTVTHTYSTASVYTATLTVTDGRGGSASASATATITAPPPVNQPPIANAGGPYSGTAGQTVAFDGSGSTDPDGDLLTYVWDFGDLTSGTGITPTHVYSAAGTFHVTLTVSDGRGGTASATVDAMIAAAPPVNHPPTAGATIPSTGLVNLPLIFTGFGSDPDGDLLTFSWNFGDGSATTPTAAAIHTYATAGTFTVTLTVNDGHGGTASASGTIVITVPAPPIAVSQQYTILPRGAGGGGLYRSQYAITLNGSGVLPLTFRIVTFPARKDPGVSMDMTANSPYQWWDPITATWRRECRIGLSPDPSCYATASSHVDLTTGTVTVTPSDAPVTVIYTPIFCYDWPAPRTDSFTFVVTDATGATSAPATISIAVDPNVQCQYPVI